MKHSPGPWENREGTILADTREQSCCGQPCVGAEYMGQQEMVCCGNPEMDGDAEDPIATVKYEHDIPLILAAPDMLAALKSALRCMEAGAELQHGKVYAVAPGSVIAMARAAISKATGGAG